MKNIRYYSVILLIGLMLMTQISNMPLSRVSFAMGEEPASVVANPVGNGALSEPIQAITHPAISTKITVDGNAADWAGIDQIADGEGYTTGLWAVQGSGKLFVLIKGKNIGLYNDIYINSDNNCATGRQNANWSDCGADYLIEDSTLYQRVNGNWTTVGNVNISRNSSVVEVSVALSQIGRTEMGEMRLSYDREDNNCAPAKGKATAVANLMIQNPTDEILFDGSTYNDEAKYLQYCLINLEIRDSNNKVLDIDGYFGNNSESALNQFLLQNQFSYFNETAKRKLMEMAESKVYPVFDSGFKQDSIKPDPMYFVYGDVSNINNRNNPFYSISVLKTFPYVVCSEPSELSYTQSRVTDSIKNSTKLYGYVSLGPTNPDENQSQWVMADLNIIKSRIDNVAQNGWYGIFIDQYGYDFKETRVRQNEIVDYVHSKGLKCFVNAWRLEDALESDVKIPGNPSGIASKLGIGDTLLLESFISDSSNYRGSTSDIEKWIKAVQYKKDKGVSVVGLTYKRSMLGWQKSMTDQKMSFVLSQSLGLDGWWFVDCLNNSKLEYGKDPQLDIGTSLIKPLHHVSGNKYSAETNKYQIEFYSGPSPYMILVPRSSSDRPIYIGQRPEFQAPSNLSVASRTETKARR